MPRTARRVSRAVLVIACAPILIFLIKHGALEGKPAPISFYSRCGADAAGWLRACLGTGAVSVLAVSVGLLHSIYRRGRGNEVNGISASHAFFYGANCLVAGNAFFAPSLPCWVNPILWGIWAGAGIVTAYHTWLRQPMLQSLGAQMARRLDAAAERAALVTQNPHRAPELMPELEEMLLALKTEVAGLRSDREGA